jgi:hypothetical protein
MSCHTQRIYSQALYSTRMNCISFNKITNSKVSSVQITDDGMICAVGLVMAMTGHDRNSAGRALRDLPEKYFSRDKFCLRQMKRQGGHETKFVSFENAIELIMVLPGKRAKLVKKGFTDIIVRYINGDRSMCHEINENESMGKIKSYLKFTSKILSQYNESSEKELRGMPQTKYIYATKSSAFPGLIKIGKSEDVSRRVSNLNTSCAPRPHVVLAVAPSFDQDRDEKIAHDFFISARRQGEFFELSDAEVIEFFASYITKRYSFELNQYTTSMRGSTIDNE